MMSYRVPQPWYLRPLEPNALEYEVCWTVDVQGYEVYTPSQGGYDS